MKTTFRMFCILFLLLLAACGAVAQPAQDGTTSAAEPPSSGADAELPLLKTALGDFAITSVQVAAETHGTQAPEGYQFLLISLAKPDLQKLVAGEFSFEDFQVMAAESEGEIYVLGSDGTQTDYQGMGGWLDSEESVSEDFAFGFLVPNAESYTLYWTDNAPIPLNVAD